MSGLQRSPRKPFLAPISPSRPGRAPSPTMTPGNRLRVHRISSNGHGAEDSYRLRDISAGDALRAFSETPMAFDTTRDEYKILACVESLTASERDLGARVARAALKVKSWCQEIEGWGWSGGFDAPSAEKQEEICQSLLQRVQGPDHPVAVPELEYWGSLPSVEVQSHEARLDEIADELNALDLDEMKEYVQDIHGPNRSRPGSSSSLLSASRSYVLLDDFSFLITQILISMLPHHHKLLTLLRTWRARLVILRSAPHYTSDLATAQNAMKLAWDALEPPDSPSDGAFEKWKVAIDTISGVLQDKVRNLGRRLDRMLDTAEILDDSLPEEWIDVFEGVEADYGRWASESRARVMAFDIRRKAEVWNMKEAWDGPLTETSAVRSSDVVPGGPDREAPKSDADGANDDIRRRHRSDTTIKVDGQDGNGQGVQPEQQVTQRSPNFLRRERDRQQILHSSPQPPDLHRALTPSPGLPPALADEDSASEFEEGDTVVHHSLSDSDEEQDDNKENQHLDDISEDYISSFSSVAALRTGSPTLHASPVIVTIGDDNIPTIEHENDYTGPLTPRSRPRRASTDSISSLRSLSSSPPSLDSPIHLKESRHAKPPRPDLNAANPKKRRPLQILEDSAIEDDEAGADSHVPWPPSQFKHHVSGSPTEDLDRQISDILTTIPAHIRLTSDPKNRSSKPRSASRQSTKPRLASKSSARFLRASRSMTGLKTPELTLSPAKPGDSAQAGGPSGLTGRRSAAALRSGDNDIKLYHLMQPGREQPIKLFIRRVGENGERVMVRVGGGWADLGEYLRQYAEHHGRRTISEGKFEVLGLDVKNNNVEGSPRPESALSTKSGLRDRRFSGGSVAAPPSPRTTPQRKNGGVGMDVARGLDDAPLLPTMASFSSTATVSTPVQGEQSADAATPSTGDTHRSWTGTEVGLAGPKAKKLDLSEQKREWIEGMMKQARTVSGSLVPPSSAASSATAPRAVSSGGHHADGAAGSRSETRDPNAKSFGDLGRVGATKRVFLRGNTLSER